jgi:hypothetical protein
MVGVMERYVSCVGCVYVLGARIDLIMWRRFVPCVDRINICCDQCHDQSHSTLYTMTGTELHQSFMYEWTHTDAHKKTLLQGNNHAEDNIHIPHAPQCKCTKGFFTYTQQTYTTFGFVNMCYVVACMPAHQRICLAVCTGQRLKKVCHMLNTFFPTIVNVT